MSTVMEQQVVGERIDEEFSWKDVLVGVATQSWLASMVFHMALFVFLALVLGTIRVAQTIGSAPEFSAQAEEKELPTVENFELGSTPLLPSELSTETLMLTEAPGIADAPETSRVIEEAGGGFVDGTSSNAGSSFGFSGANSLGPMVPGAAGLGRAQGLSNLPGMGGAGKGFGSRFSNRIGSGATKDSERAVGAALKWIARHQNKDGSWSLKHSPNCKGGICSWPGEEHSDCAATALGLLPFLAAGQTQDNKGPYSVNIQKGIKWLIGHQKPNGDLSAGAYSQMYSHGLAAIALCEDFGMTQDQEVGYAAQKAVNFIESGQNTEGGWRYKYKSDDSDTSVFGWQLMALKSGQMAGLKVDEEKLRQCKRYLELCQRGNYNCEFSYTPGGGAPTYSMTAIGILMSQYLGAKRDDPVVVNGIDYLMTRKPDLTQRNTYYWYYATQALHNVPGPQWDEWNRDMRRILIETQEAKGCAEGSWNPQVPEPDPWGRPGGRLMVTSLSALTLEVYYRYLPLYKLDQ